MKVYVSVPRKVCPAWWPKPWSEMVEAARAGVDGLEFIENPGGWREKPNGERCSWKPIHSPSRAR